MKNGDGYANFGCTTHDRAAPRSARTTARSALGPREAVLGALIKELDAPDLVERFTEVFTKKWKELSTDKNSPPKQIEPQVEGSSAT